MAPTALMGKTPWQLMMDKWAGRPYDWPVAYCVPSIHDYLYWATGHKSRYYGASGGYDNERACIRSWRTTCGSLKAAHSWVLGDVPGVKVAYDVLNAHLAWVDEGYLIFEDGATGALRDFNGIMLMRSQEGGPWHAWRDAGITKVVDTRDATISKMWSIG